MTINNIKYHKTEAGYFKYEPIKWRVLQSENGEAFLLSDVILDKQAIMRTMNILHGKKVH